MNKSELIKIVSKQTTLTKKEANLALRAITQTIGDALKSGEKVQLVGFGKFEVKNRMARETINPRTKERMLLPEKKVPCFKAHKSLKQSIG